MPETLIAGKEDFYILKKLTAMGIGKGGFSKETLAEYARVCTPENIHAVCEDYRATVSIDLEHDAADLDHRIRCPVNVLWAADGAMDRLYDVLAIWRERARNVTGKGMPGGHNMQEGAPDEVLAELRAFLRA